MIHPKVTKETKAALVDPLTSIFNKSLNEGAIPEIWKCANVTAVFKNVDQLSTNQFNFSAGENNGKNYKRRFGESYDNQ